MMYILTVAGKERDGAYSVQDDEGTQILYLFEDEIMIKTCKVHGYNYTVITPNDVVIPPKIKHDFI